LINSSFPRWILVALIIVVGVAERVRLWAADNSLWLDEASIALNVVERSPLRLLQPLDYGQVAPPVFLELMKLATWAFGPGELALRLVPLISGIAACVVFYFAARELIGDTGALLSLWFFSTASGLVKYSSEAKQYSGDVLATSFALWLTARILNRDDKPLLFVAYGVVATMLIWFSHPAAFVLVGMSSAMLIARRRTHLRWVVLASIPWAASFAGLYVLSLRRFTKDTGLLDFWSEAFVPHNLGAFRWFYDTTVQAFRLLSVNAIPIAAVLAVVGVVLLSRGGHWWRAIMVTLPIAAALAASAFRLYPIAGRLELFLVPCVLILFAGAITHVAAMFPRIRILSMCVVLVLFSRTALQFAYRVATHPEQFAVDFRDVFRAAEKDPRCANGPIVVQEGDARTLTFYKRHLNIDPRNRAVITDRISSRCYWQVTVPGAHLSAATLAGPGAVALLIDRDEQ